MKFPTLSTQQIDGVNIGLMFISLVLAFILPFELFLFSYAVLGPLHYLTEISWLHKKSYFVKGKWDYLWFIVLGLLVFVASYQTDFMGEKPKPDMSGWGTNLIFLAFAGAFIMVAFPKRIHKLLAFGVLTFFAIVVNLETVCVECLPPAAQAGASVKELCNSEMKTLGGFYNKWSNQGYTCSSMLGSVPLFFSYFLPTLIHVFIFTALFMLFGAFKSGSKLGLISVGLLFVCAALPFVWDPSFINYTISEAGKQSYDVSFFSLNQAVFNVFNLGPDDPQTIYSSSMGISLTRFIAFAYTYHYLNWFSKTSIIQWHKMPVLNLVAVGLLWVASVAVYYINYELGLKYLFFLSFLHVFMEFPLNFQSIIGIFKSIRGGFSTAKPA